MHRALAFAARAVAALALTTLLRVHAARAEQFVLTDVSYTHSTTTTTDSHYRVVPLPGTPSNWTSPVDYTKGSAFVRLEVKTKPAGNAPTKFQICFEGSNSYACTNQSMTYTAEGTQQWTTPFANFYIGNGVKLDWTKGVGKVALILKDDMNGKPAPENVDAGIVKLYMPTELHVVVGIASEGATFKLPPGAGVDAGASDGGKADASAAEAGAADAATSPARPDASAAIDAALQYDAGSTEAGAGSIARTDAGDDATAAGDEDAGAEREAHDSGCQLSQHPGRAIPLWAASLLALFVLRRRRCREI